MSEAIYHDPQDEPGQNGSGRKRRGGLFVTDAELIEILGLPRKEGYRTLRYLDEKRQHGFPQKSKIWCGRRYLPAVRQWLDRNNGIKIDPPKGGHDDP